MTESSNIERTVMRRVRTISILRPIFSGAVLALVVSVIALWGIGREVWVAKVFANGPQDFFGHVQYLLYAFGHTRMLVQALSLATIASLVYLAREVSRTAREMFTPLAA